MRFALKVAYVGTDFHGSQVQPAVRTVEGELLRALAELDIISNRHESNYISAGRTDKGVHALGMVVAFDTNKPDIVKPRAINSKLPDTVWVYAKAEVPDDFDPKRQAMGREYRYIMYGKYDISLLRKASRILKGVHDFTNFSTREEGRTTICDIKKIDVRVEGDFTILDVKANHFVWHMVRKIATALELVGSGARDVSWLEQMLEPSEFNEGVEPAPAHGLIFKKVNYENIDWVEETYALKLIKKNLDRGFLWYGVMAEMLKELKSGMEV